MKESQQQRREVSFLSAFAVNRTLCRMINEAVYALIEGVGTVKEIDDFMVLGMNHAIGPVHLQQA